MEIHKLHDMLTEAGIEHEWKDRSLMEDGRKLETPPCGMLWGHQVIVYKEDGERLVSAVEGYGTYGYMNWFDLEHPGDAIEIMGLLTDEEAESDTVVGFLTAEEVFERIKKVVVDGKTRGAGTVE